MLIRAWQKEDNQKICYLESQCFSDPWSLGMIESAHKGSNFTGFVVEENGEVVGYIGAQSLLDEGEILLVAVDKNSRGKGYGKRLVETVMQNFKSNGVEKLFLEVRKSNAVAISCYERCGFEKIAERKRYYSDGEDAIIMENRL